MEQMKLNDTVIHMLSGDYKHRFLAEYWQTKIRYEKLKRYCDEIEVADTLIQPGPQHDTPLFLLRGQQKYMGELLHILELRAIYEHIDLEEVNQQCSLSV